MQQIWLMTAGAAATNPSIYFRGCMVESSVDADCLARPSWFVAKAGLLQNTICKRQTLSPVLGSRWKLKRWPSPRPASRWCSPSDSANNKLRGITCMQRLLLSDQSPRHCASCLVADENVTLPTTPPGPRAAYSSKFLPQVILPAA